MSQEPPPSPSPSPCPHLAGYRSNAHGISKPLRSLGRCLRPLHTLGRAEVRRDPHEIPRCGICFASSSSFLPSPRLYACLACASVSCPAHAPAHAAAAPGHEIAVDVDRAELFCCACRDQVYDREFDSAVVLAHFARSNMSASSAIDSSSSSVRRRKTRRRADYRPWAPDPAEWAAIRKGSKPIPPPDGEGLPRGLRGMNNLGNTCFMSSVLQALLHTPPLRNYFLSDLHNRYVCQQKGRRKKSAPAGIADGGNGSRPVCLACDLDAMYSAVFSGDRAPYSPAKFLYR